MVKFQLILGSYCFNVQRPKGGPRKHREAGDHCRACPAPANSEGKSAGVPLRPPGAQGTRPSKPLPKPQPKPQPRPYPPYQAPTTPLPSPFCSAAKPHPSPTQAPPKPHPSPTQAPPKPHPSPTQAPPKPHPSPTQAPPKPHPSPTQAPPKPHPRPWKTGTRTTTHSAPVHREATMRHAQRAGRVGG